MKYIMFIVWGWLIIFALSFSLVILTVIIDTWKKRSEIHSWKDFRKLYISQNEDD